MVESKISYYNLFKNDLEYIVEIKNFYGKTIDVWIYHNLNLFISVLQNNDLNGVTDYFLEVKDTFGNLIDEVSFDDKSELINYLISGDFKNRL